MKARFLILCCCLAGIYGGWVYHTRVLAQNTRKPHIIQYVVYHPTETGASGQYTLQLTEAVRADGAVMKESIQLAANTGHLGIRELTLPQERIRATLDLELKTKLITALNARDIEQVTGTVPSSCEAAYQLPRTKVVCTHVNGESFLGYPVHRVRQTATFGTDELVKEILATPSLDWAPLQISVFNSGRLVEQRKAVLVQEVEPNSSLFVVPADYNVLSAPSQMISGALKARKQTYDPEKLSRLDKAFESRQKAPNK